MSAPEAEKDASLAELLGRVGGELASAAREVDDLHVLVTYATAEELTSDSFVRRVQTIDLLQQHLQALSHFMCALSRTVPTGWVVSGEAADGVKLARLRERLSRGSLAETDEEGSAGDLFVF